MSRNRWLLGCALLIAASVVIIGLAFLVVNLAITGGDRLTLSPLTGRVGLVEIVGEIDDPESVVDQLDRMQRDTSIRAVVLRLDSPGGGVAASQEIYESVKKLRDEGKKPVIASMGGVAASGAYYVACAADSIVANAGTLTGSIGVIMTFPNTEDLFRKVGIRFETIKTGKYKDIGTMWRPMTDEERKLLQDVLSNVYDQFVDAIVEGRGLAREDILPYADGRIFSGDQALEYGFVDRLGDLDDSIRLAGEMAGITGQPVVVRKERRHVSFLDLVDNKMNQMTGLSSHGPRLEYRLR
ncbi:MAG TPA: signal peptide peptidase SppA [Candidatus Limnocylindrales bacterium]|nr:signal peptide peptidase SppA [Candidatus Limnocylindrales bacterium]